MLKQIKNTIRDYLIILFFLTGIPYLRYLYLKKTKGPLLRVLVFHDVESKYHFEKLISFLDKKFNIISSEEFKQNQLSKDKINILLTFDDGYKSWVDNVLPVLEGKNLKGIFFISSGFIEAGDRGEEKKYLEEKLKLKSDRTPLSWGEVKELEDASMEIGGHTVNHVNLAKISEKEGREEIQKDKKMLEKKLDRKIKFFAYPFGHSGAVNENIVELVKNAGYECGFTANINFSIEDSHEYKLNRDCLDGQNSLLLNIAKIYGSYDFIKILLNSLIFIKT
ncbi:MAG: polysaccharide deacetylase family protein [Candidatus Magasanikbacteria bacterium]